MNTRRLNLSDGRELDAVPWEDEPLHHCLQRTDWCVVYEARLPPGRTTLWHVHSRNTVYACIADGSERGKPVISTAVNDTGDDLNQPVELEVGCGESFCMWHAEKPFTHQVKARESNVGETRFLGIEILCSPSASGRRDELDNFRYSLMEDRAPVKIWKLCLPPETATGMHSITSPSVFVALVGGNIEASGNVIRDDAVRQDATFPFQARYCPGQFHVLEDPLDLCILNRGPNNFQAMLVQWSNPSGSTEWGLTPSS